MLLGDTPAAGLAIMPGLQLELPGAQAKLSPCAPGEFSLLGALLLGVAAVIRREDDDAASPHGRIVDRAHRPRGLAMPAFRRYAT